LRERHSKFLLQAVWSFRQRNGPLDRDWRARDEDAAPGQFHSKAGTGEANGSVGPIPGVTRGGWVPNRPLAPACYCFNLFHQTPTRESNSGQFRPRDVKAEAHVAAVE